MEVVIEVTYPDGTKDTVKVPVEVTDNRANADKYEPTVEKEQVEIGGKVDLTDNVTNLPDFTSRNNCDRCDAWRYD